MSLTTRKVKTTEKSRLPKMATCPAICKSGQPCRYRVYQYGVCRQHKSWAYQAPADAKLTDYMHQLVKLTRQIQDSAVRYESRGLNVLNMQAPWKGNLCNQLGEVEIANITDPDVRQFVAASEGSRNLITTVQKEFDPYLVCNLGTGIQQSILDGNNPTLAPFMRLCRLGAQPFLN